MKKYSALILLLTSFICMLNAANKTLTMTGSVPGPVPGSVITKMQDYVASGCDPSTSTGDEIINLLLKKIDIPNCAQHEVLPYLLKNPSVSGSIGPNGINQINPDANFVVNRINNYSLGYIRTLALGTDDKFDGFSAASGALKTQSERARGFIGFVARKLDNGFYMFNTDLKVDYLNILSKHLLYQQKVTEAFSDPRFLGNAGGLGLRGRRINNAAFIGYAAIVMLKAIDEIGTPIPSTAIWMTRSELEKCVITALEQFYELTFNDPTKPKGLLKLHTSSNYIYSDGPHYFASHITNVLLFAKVLKENHNILLSSTKDSIKDLVIENNSNTTLQSAGYDIANSNLVKQPILNYASMLSPHLGSLVIGDTAPYVLDDNGVNYRTRLNNGIIEMYFLANDKDTKEKLKEIIKKYFSLYDKKYEDYDKGLSLKLMFANIVTDLLAENQSYKQDFENEEVTVFRNNTSNFKESSVLAVTHPNKWRYHAHYHSDIGGFQLYYKGVNLIANPGYARDAWIQTTMANNGLMITGQPDFAALNYPIDPDHDTKYNVENIESNITGPFSNLEHHINQLWMAKIQPTPHVWFINSPYYKPNSNEDKDYNVSCKTKNIIRKGTGNFKQLSFETDVKNYKVPNSENGNPVKYIGNDTKDDVTWKRTFFVDYDVDATATDKELYVIYDKMVRPDVSQGNFNYYAQLHFAPKTSSTRVDVTYSSKGEFFLDRDNTNSIENKLHPPNNLDIKLKGCMGSSSNPASITYSRKEDLPNFQTNKTWYSTALRAKSTNSNHDSSFLTVLYPYESTTSTNQPIIEVDNTQTNPDAKFYAAKIKAKSDSKIVDYYVVCGSNNTVNRPFEEILAQSNFLALKYDTNNKKVKRMIIEDGGKLGCQTKVYNRTEPIVFKTFDNFDGKLTIEYDTNINIDYEDNSFSNPFCFLIPAQGLSKVNNIGNFTLNYFKYGNQFLVCIAPNSNLGYTYTWPEKNNKTNLVIEGKMVGGNIPAQNLYYTDDNYEYRKFKIDGLAEGNVKVYETDELNILSTSTSSTSSIYKVNSDASYDFEANPQNWFDVSHGVASYFPGFSEVNTKFALKGKIMPYHTDGIWSGFSNDDNDDLVLFYNQTADIQRIITVPTGGTNQYGCLRDQFTSNYLLHRKRSAFDINKVTSACMGDFDGNGYDDVAFVYKDVVDGINKTRIVVLRTLPNGDPNNINAPGAARFADRNGTFINRTNDTDISFLENCTWFELDSDPSSNTDGHTWANNIVAITAGNLQKEADPSKQKDELVIVYDQDGANNNGLPQRIIVLKNIQNSSNAQSFSANGSFINSSWVQRSNKNIFDAERVIDISCSDVDHDGDDDLYIVYNKNRDSDEFIDLHILETDGMNSKFLAKGIGINLNHEADNFMARSRWYASDLNYGRFKKATTGNFFGDKRKEVVLVFKYSDSYKYISVVTPEISDYSFRNSVGSSSANNTLIVNPFHYSSSVYWWVTDMIADGESRNFALPNHLLAGNFINSGYTRGGTYFTEERNDTPELIKFEAQNYPNPFNPETQIRYSLPEEGDVKITVYNIKGQKVKTLVNEHKNMGHHNVTWKGKNANGNKVGSGVYFYKVKTKNKTLVNKMLLMK